MSGSDTLTVATTADPNLRLTKRWRRNTAGELEKIGFSAGMEFYYREEPVADVYDLARALDLIAADSRSCIVRGKPKAGVIGKRSLRRSRDHKDGKATLDPKARRWLLLDFDKVPVPAGMNWQADPETAVAHLVSLLPPEFANTTCWWAFTASMGLEPGLRMRLGFWLNRALDAPDLKAWLKGAPIDSSLFGVVQPIYIAPPIFDNPADDPFRSAARLGRMIGARDVVAAPPQEMLSMLTGERKPSGSSKSKAGRLAPVNGDWRSALALIGDGDGREGFLNPIKSVVGKFFQENGSGATADTLRSALVEAITAAPRDKALHGDRVVHDRVAILDGLIEWVREQQARSEADIANAEAPWAGARASVEAGRRALDVWLMTYFRFNHPDARDVRSAVAAYEVAKAAWDERRERWQSLQDFREADPFEERPFPEPPPTPTLRFERAGFKVTPGVGKTTSAVRELAARLKACPWECAVYAVPGHDKGTEIRDEFAKHGIAAEIWRGFEYPVHDPACSRAAEVRSLDARLSELCKGCPFHPAQGGACAYQEQRKRNPGVWIVPHATLRFAPRMLSAVFDWLVIDEAYAIPIDESCIGIEELCSVEGNDRRHNSRRYEAVVERTCGILTGHAIGPLTRDALAELGRETCAAMSAAAMLSRVSPVGVAPEALAGVSAANDRAERRHWFWSILGDFLAGGNADSGRLFWTGSSIRMQVVSGIANGWLQAHVLVLDATLNANVAQRWLPDLNVWTSIEVDTIGHARFIKAPPVAFNKIVPGDTDPDTRRTQENNLRRVWHRIEAEAGARAAVGQKTLAILPKGAEAWIRGVYGPLPPYLHITHFGNLRGINKYEDVSKLIVVSRTQLPVGEVQRLTAALFDRPVDTLPDGYLDKRLRLLRMRDNSTQPVLTEVHPDDDAQALLEQYREAEGEQAAHRTRPVNQRCEIDLVCIVGINMTIDDVLSFDEWIAEGDITALALARGILPNTTTALANVVSDACSDRKAVEHYFRTTNGARRAFDAAVAAANAVKTPNSSYLLGVFTAFAVDVDDLPPWREFRCRLRGKRKGFRVWINPAVADPRALAERYFGPPDEFTATTPAAKTAQRPTVASHQPQRTHTLENTSHA